MKEEKILPCPFCKSDNVSYDGSFIQSVTIEWQDGCVECDECGASGSIIRRNSKDDKMWGENEIRDEAISKWNDATIKNPQSQNELLSLIKKYKSLKEKSDELLKEVSDGHVDKDNGVNYNECEIESCLWCDEAKKIINQLKK